MIAADPHSYSNPLESCVRHIELDLAVSFTERKLRGAVTLSLDPAGPKLVLDTRDLTIRRVNGRTENCRVGARDAIRGSPLEIDRAPGERSVLI
ncbi:MAG: aminopeptidase, partial [Bryobacteraceae bacterium]